MSLLFTGLTFPKTKSPHQDKSTHPNEGLILTLNSYAFPQLPRLEARKMSNATSWYQFISQKIDACQSLLSPKRKPQHIVVG
jgi:hypothetical protein